MAQLSTGTLARLVRAVALGDALELAALAGPEGSVASAFAAARAFPDPGDAPIAALAEARGFEALDLFALVLAALVDLEPALTEATGADPRRLTVGRVVALARQVVPEADVGALVGGAAVRDQALVIDAERLPFPLRAVSVPSLVLLALCDRQAWVGGLSLEAPRVPVPPSASARVARAAGALDEDGILVLRGGHEGELRALAAVACGSRERAPAFVEPGDPVLGLGPWLMLTGRLPVHVARLGPSERFRVVSIRGYAGPQLVLCGPDGAVEAVDRLPTALRVEVPEAGERAALWRVAVGDTDIAGVMAEAHRHGAGRIADLGALALEAARGEAREVGLHDVVAASVSAESAGLSALAHALPDRIDDDAIVLPPRLRDELLLVIGRCRAREAIQTRLGPAAAARYRPGLRALFSGPSGTGKSLAAGWLATRLQLPLFRVDTAAVVSKYIGETEKNLSDLLARAESAEVVLFFDEADALFGRRTEVQHATDRYANAQTNYLLQRMESYDGIVVLASNNRSRFDPAFTRRLDAIVEFPPPSASERVALWRAHLPADHALADREILALGAHVDLAGGHIRNAVLVAAVLAHERGGPPRYDEVVRGVELEYRKLGRAMSSVLVARGDGRA